MMVIPSLLVLLLLAVESIWAFSSIGSSIHISTSHRGATNAIESALSSATKSTDTPTHGVRKVAIIGSGIAGLSLAHALRSTNMGSKQPIQIDIFDSRAALDEKSGSGIQLTGGMAALRQISPTLQQSVSEASLPLERVVSTCRPWFGGDGMESWKIFELDLQQAIREKDATDKAKAAEENESGVTQNNIGLVTEEGEVLAYTILRGTLQRILQEQLMQEYGIEVQFDKRLCGIDEGGYCQFTDGSKTGKYDLVVGCDGIQSAVRQYIQLGAIDPSKTESAIYSGLRITFAIKEEEDTEDDIANREGCQFTQYFGNGAYALTSSYGAGKGKPRAKGAFLVYPDANYIGPFPRQKSDDKDADSIKAASVNTSSEANPLEENADWTQDNRIPKEKILECLEVLQAASIPGNDVASIIEKSDRFFDLGVYLHNPFSSWVREIPNSNDAKIFAVTTGDAAHAMPPFLGQGANQALQDSCSLARRIHEYNNQSSDVTDLKSVLKEYENRRWLPTTSITAKAAILGYLEVGPGLIANFRDIFFFVMGKLNVAKKVFMDASTPKM